MAGKFRDMKNDDLYSDIFRRKYRKKLSSSSSSKRSFSSRTSSINSDDSAYYSNPQQSCYDGKTDEDESFLVENSKIQSFSEKLDLSFRSHGTKTSADKGFFENIHEKQVHSPNGTMNSSIGDINSLNSVLFAFENESKSFMMKKDCNNNNNLENLSYSDCSSNQEETQTYEWYSKFNSESQDEDDYNEMLPRMIASLDNYGTNSFTNSENVKEYVFRLKENENQKSLQPSLEYFRAPIFPYCQKNYLDEEKQRAALDIRNVVTRQYGKRMRETVQRIDKSMTKMRENRPFKCGSENEEVYQAIDSKTFDSSHLTELMTVRSKTNRKFRSGINDLIKLRRNASEASLDNVLEFSIDLGDELQQILGEQDIIIQQAKKALEVCQRDKKFTKSSMLIEIERVILKANITKDVIEKYRREERPLDPEDRSGFIKISNIRIKLKKYVKPKGMKSYFVGILHCGKSVYCSNLINWKKKKLLELPDAYLFKELPSDCKIVIQIYVIHSDAGYKRSLRELVKNYSLFLKSFLTRSTPELREEGIYSFELCGKFQLKKKENKGTSFLLEDLLDHNQIMESFQYDIENGVDLKYNISGYLLVCLDAEQGDWTQHWCELAGNEVKIWDSLDFRHQPKVIIDLSESLFPRVLYADEEIRSRHKTLHLRIKREVIDGNVQHRDFFFTSDDQAVLSDWKIKMNIVLMNLRNWGCMKV